MYDKETLIKLCKNRRMIDVANETGVSESTIRRGLTTYKLRGITRRQKTTLSFKNYILLSDKLALKQQLVNKTLNEAISSLQLSATTLRNAIEKHNLSYVVLAADFDINTHRRTFSEKAVVILSDQKLLVDMLMEYSVNDVACQLNVNNMTIWRAMKKFNINKDTLPKYASQIELKIAAWLTQNNFEFITNDRNLLEGKELDFYIPSCDLAIECNGYYWHSAAFKEQLYHHKKWKSCMDKNITLLQFLEPEINNSFDMVVATILANCKVKPSFEENVTVFNDHQSAVYFNNNGYTLIDEIPHYYTVQDATIIKNDIEVNSKSHVHTIWTSGYSRWRRNV